MVVHASLPLAPASIFLVTVSCDTRVSTTGPRTLPPSFSRYVSFPYRFCVLAFFFPMRHFSFSLPLHFFLLLGWVCI
ncbi:hypothetical protein EDB85DRAFT_2017379 [Lactarius pseudohatsudake]|nr:hypothetical protein EDB85DRAFT_2017379 [Lactarius pseudohatsudake]